MLQPTQKLPEQQWLSLEATTSLPLSTRPSFPMTPEAGCPKSRSTAIHWVAQALTNKKSKPFWVACSNIPKCTWTYLSGYQWTQLVSFYWRFQKNTFLKVLHWRLEPRKDSKSEPMMSSLFQTHKYRKCLWQCKNHPEPIFAYDICKELVWCPFYKPPRKWTWLSGRDHILLVLLRNLAVEKSVLAKRENFLYCAFLVFL